MTAKKQSWVRFGVAAWAALLPVSGCICEPVDVFNPVAPRISVSACTTPDDEPTQDCELAFGNADISVTTERRFIITNPSALKLTFVKQGENDGIYIDTTTGDGEFEFISPPPTELGAGLSAEVGVRIRPQFESTITRDIVIVSDANNVPRPQGERISTIRIPITLTGVDNGLPDIEVVPQGCGETNPLSVDFGRVATGGAKVCNLAVKNVGSRDLVFDSVELVAASEGGPVVDEPAESDAEPGIKITNAPEPGQALPPTGEATDANAPLNLRVAFAPDVLGRWTGVLRFLTNDPNETEVLVPLVGVGVNAPTCEARVKSVNGIEVEGVPSIEPLDDVVLEANVDSATPDTSIATYQWELIERGPGSGAALSNPTGRETGFTFAGRSGVDVAGTFEACVVATDDLGTTNAAPCCVSFDATPQDSFLVQLTWAAPTGDMDLHVSKRNEDGQYCLSGLGSSGTPEAPFTTSCTAANLDCYYGNCKPGSGGAPNWDSEAARGPGDPSLDVDDLSGFGPENTNVDLAEPGSYAFGVDYFSGSAPYPIFVRLFVFGQLQGEWVQNIDDEFFEVGILHISADDPFNPCIEDLTDGDPSNQCPDFE